jgi:ribonucleotide reductase alpha subunit
MTTEHSIPRAPTATTATTAADVDTSVSVGTRVPEAAAVSAQLGGIRASVDAARIPQEYMHLITNYNPVNFESAVKALASRIESTDLIELAGRLIIFESVLVAGTLEMYLSSLGHRLSDRVRGFVARNIVELQAFLNENEELNYFDHDFFSASALTRGYLLQPHFGEQSVESPAMMYLRVAAHKYATDTGRDGMDDVQSVWLDIANHVYTPPSPDFYNAGTKTPQCSSCFLLTSNDTIEGIIGSGALDVARISKTKGGIGICLTPIRHSAIAGAGMSAGVKPVLRIINEVIKYADQGGKRKGAANAYLAIDHIDIKDFINATNNFSQSQAARIDSLNTTVWMHDIFYRRVAANGKWTVFCPAKSGLFGLYGEEYDVAYEAMEKLAVERKAAVTSTRAAHVAKRSEYMQNPRNHALQDEVSAALNAKRLAEKAQIEHATYDAAEIMEHICNLQIKSGFPFLMNGDAVNAMCNQANLGAVNSSNLCTEITEVSSPESIASCNLSSVSLKKFARGPIDYHTVVAWDQDPDLTPAEIVRRIVALGVYDFDGLATATRRLGANLNRTIDRNFYPAEEKTRQPNMDARPLGIGVSGLSDAFAVLNIRFESKAAEGLNQAIFACMYYNALCASCEQARAIAPNGAGAYALFRTGTFSLPRAVNEPAPPGTRAPTAARPTSANTPGVVSETFEGSPLANGFFQFDLWARRAGVNAARGHLNAKIYARENDAPMQPVEWGQKACALVAEPSWDALRSHVQDHGVRNSLLLTCMPTATSSQIMRNAEATEQHVAHLYQRTVTTGRFMVVNQHMVKDLEAHGMWNEHMIEYLQTFEGSLRHMPMYVADNPDKFGGAEHVASRATELAHIRSKYATMFEISQKTNLRFARQRAIYIDQSQSTNIYVFDPSIEKMTAIHMYTHALGLKTNMYYLRQKNTTDAGAFDQSASMLAYRRNLIGTAGVSVAATTRAPEPAACAVVEADCEMCGA